VPPDGSGRLFLVDQTGLIRIIAGGKLLARPFLDIRKKVVRLTPDYDERGLLGLAFHPGFATNGRFFVYYSAPTTRAGTNHIDRLSEFRVARGAPNQADPGTERSILEFPQPQPNHDGGALGFRPDGFLYLGAGDGGGVADASRGHSPGGNGQDTSKLNGKIMRIDVDHRSGGRAYAVPSDNPFAAGGGRPEIYAYGLRNPWRLAWEPTGERRLIVSDVGQGRFEEVDVVVRGGNYGWRIREGRHCFSVDTPLRPPGSCPMTGARGDLLVWPVVEYSHADIGIAVVGGYVHRGSGLPAFAGQYVFGDFSADWTTPEPQGRGSLLAAVMTSGDEGRWDWRRLTIGGGLEAFVTGMGEGPEGELYLMTQTNLGPTGRTGRVFEIVPPPA